MTTQEKIKGYFTKQNIALAIACLAFLFEAGRFFYGNNSPNAGDILFKRDIESLKKNDATRAKELAGIQEQRAKDSLQLSSIKAQVENVPTIISQISSKYEKERRNLAVQSIDSRLQFFTNSLSQEDSSSNGGNGD